MRWIFLFVLSLFSFISKAQKTSYDQKLADSLGADAYGMKMYVLAILKTGPAKITDKKVNDSLFAGHMSNIGRLVKEGKLIVAGPLGNNDKNYRGIFIYNVPTRAEAEALVATDPTVHAKVFEVEFYEWYGSAALPMYLQMHNRIEKQSH